MSNNSERYAWYTVVVVPNKEEQVIESLKNKINATKMGEFFQDFKIFKEPKISKTELEKKQRGENYVVKYINLYKGYVFINMLMTDDTWYLTRNTEYVTGIVGSHGDGVKPTPISKREFRRLLDSEIKHQKAFEERINQAPFLEGDLIKIIAGPLVNEEQEIYYKVKQVNEKMKYVTIDYESLGRKIVTEISWDHIEKMKK
ncbi:transcription termination/antitermination NusG family protein [Mycoplasmopsis agassizii]|uniref:Transcription termination/antitermination protein NusG n=1 Tax=Mycoplasmopsis agassizii TaxID=33922 RepID=A0ABX4H471_9BACT|nr:transcription termination/antitermination protein NusG [Mycoplasmopsis agassizii]PAF54685.1 transcription termination/antitermination protein NusG [Mycoplasmopsis agassizii]SMC16046.1 transcriptional antiterminator NusG [Mycoplasmopsis agassizii]